MKYIDKIYNKLFELLNNLIKNKLPNHDVQFFHYVNKTRHKLIGTPS